MPTVIIKNTGKHRSHKGNSAYLEDVDELGVSDLAVLVEIEMVVDGSQFLAGKEDSELGEEFFELKLGKSAVLVLVSLSNYCKINKRLMSMMRG